MEVESRIHNQALEASTGSPPPLNLTPEIDYEQLSEQDLHENYLQSLDADEGAQRWAVAHSVNKHADFIRLFAQTKAHLEANFARKNVAAHELGHAHVVRAVGGEVDEISIIPQGRTLGFTRYRLRALRDLVQTITTRIACAAGSRIAEEKVGVHDHCGCAGDDGMIKALSFAGHRLTRGLISAGWFESEGRKIASNAMSSYSSSDLDKDATALVAKHPVAAVGRPISLEKFREQKKQRKLISRINIQKAAA